MRKLVLAAFIAATGLVQANYIVKYRSGKAFKSIVDPRSLGAAALSSDGDELEYVEENIMLHRTGVNPNDSQFYRQWALNSYAGGAFLDAQDEVSGGAQVVVAVLDTGILDHSDISANLVDGYDFISNPSVANDSNGRDSDPRDPGDKCGNTNSSWHGSHVAGIIAAQINNAKGIAGAGTNIKVAPIRVLGACGGELFDIADALRWAAGGSISGVPNNPTPAKVINMSLGGQAYCSRYMQSAIDYAKSRGAVVVVSAGNAGRNIDDLSYTPANCRGVLRVGSFGSGSYISSFSNYGNIVDISAPGDNIWSLSDMGTDSPSFETYKPMGGTSMSAGFISAAAAMVFSMKPSLYPDQVRGIIKRTAGTFWCPYSNCSNSAVDPYYAVRVARDEVPNSGYVYNDPVLTPGFSPFNATVSADDDGGGSCGTITDVSGNGPGGKTLISLLMLITLFHIGMGKIRRSS